MTPRYSIRDFGYPEDDPLHYGIQDSRRRLTKLENGSKQYLSSDSDDDEDDDDDVESSIDDEPLNQKAVALYSFSPENDNELQLTENQIVLISYRYGQGWLVAHDPNTGKTGLIPEEYVELYLDDDDDDDDDDVKHGQEEATPFLPAMLQDHTVEGNESDWIDEDEDFENGDGKTV